MRRVTRSSGKCGEDTNLGDRSSWISRLYLCDCIVLANTDGRRRAAMACSLRRGDPGPHAEKADQVRSLCRSGELRIAIIRSFQRHLDLRHFLMISVGNTTIMCADDLMVKLRRVGQEASSDEISTRRCEWISVFFDGLSCRQIWSVSCRGCLALARMQLCRFLGLKGQGCRPTCCQPADSWPAGTPTSTPKTNLPKQLSDMKRITPWRVIKTALAIHFCVSAVLPAIWLSLPCPPVSVEERAQYIQDTLSAGRPLIAAWDAKAFRRTDRRALEADWCSDCTSALFHWQFARLYNKINILLTPHDPHTYVAGDRPFAVADHFMYAKVWNERSTGRNDTWSPYFVTLWDLPVIVPAGQLDEHISREWFNEVDRHLIQYTFLQRRTDVDVHVAIPEPGVVEFWRGAAVDRAFNDTSDGWADPLNKADIFKDHTRTPGIYKQMRKVERDIDLMASFEVPEIADFKNIVVRDLKGDLPSRTWPFRQKLISLFPHYIVGSVMLFNDVDAYLAPHFAGFIVTLIVLLPAYLGTVFCCWISAGCPRVFAWVSRFCLTKYLIPKRWRAAPAPDLIWGSSGPIGSTVRVKELEEDKQNEFP